MPSLEKKTLAAPDRELTFDKTHGAIVDLDGMTVGRYTYGPGWRWVDILAPVTGTDVCEVEHFGYALVGSAARAARRWDRDAGRRRRRLPHQPAPSGEVVGDEPFETIEFLPAARDATTRGSALG